MKEEKDKYKNNPIFKDILKNNTKRANDLMLKVMWGFLVIIIMIGILDMKDIFKVETAYIITWGSVVFLSVVIMYSLRHMGISEEGLKYYITAVLLLSILLGGYDGSVGIYSIYILPAIISVAYMDRKFTYIVCAIAYVIMVLCLFTGSEFRVRYTFMGYTRTSWFILYTIGYTLEFIGLVFGVHVASLRAESIVEDLCKQNEKINDMHTSIIMGFAGLVEARDSYTGLHVKRTAEVVKLLMMSMKKMGLYSEELTKENMRNIEMAAPLHDVGKIMIPDAILCKPGKFTDEEYTEMKKHARAGKDIIDKYLAGMQETDFIETARDITLSHHERWDGEGYPQRLKGKMIPLGARIMAVADVFDALVSKRCYKAARTFDEAFDTILENQGTHLDPNIVDAFVRIEDELRQLYDIDEETGYSRDHDVVDEKKHNIEEDAKLEVKEYN